MIRGKPNSRRMERMLRQQQKVKILQHYQLIPPIIDLVSPRQEEEFSEKKEKSKIVEMEIDDLFNMIEINNPVEKTISQKEINKIPLQTTVERAVEEKSQTEIFAETGPHLQFQESEMIIFNEIVPNIEVEQSGRVNEVEPSVQYPIADIQTELFNEVGPKLQNPAADLQKGLFNEIGPKSQYSIADRQTGNFNEVCGPRDSQTTHLAEENEIDIGRHIQYINRRIEEEKKKLGILEDYKNKLERIRRHKNNELLNILNEIYTFINLKIK